METKEFTRSAFSTRFTGRQDNKIDSKGRMSIPAQFRASLQKEAGDEAVLFCFPTFGGGAIDCGGPTLIDTLLQIVSNEDVLDARRHALEVAIYSRLQQLSFDETGRVLLPKSLRDHAGLDNQAVIIGLGERFQIAPPVAHEDILSLADAVIDENPDIVRGAVCRVFPAGGSAMTDQHSHEFGHIPVLGVEAVQALAPVDGGVYVDATMGGGGYTRAILGAANCSVYAFDRDPVAIERAAAWSGAYAGRLTLLPHPFGDMADVLPALGVSQVDGIVFDLGVSSVQLDEGARGFSFQQDGPLNMRMDQSGDHTAADLVNLASEKDLADIFYIFGEEKKSRSIARAIVSAREEAPFRTTGQLAQIVENAAGPRGKEKIHPATRVFQAIRIFINAELDQLARGLLAAEQLLVTAGRLAVVTFHSLEDRIVKRFLSLRSETGVAVSRHMPGVQDGPAPTFTLLHRKAVGPSDQEVADNPRARSAKLRVGVRTDATAAASDKNFLRAIGLPQPVLSPAINNWS